MSSSSSQIQTFSSLSALHEHLRGSQIVRLEGNGRDLCLIVIPAGQSHSQCRKISLTFDDLGFLNATSEPTEFSEWF